MTGKSGMKCPRCGLFNPPSAVRCDCGWDFASKTMKESYLSSAELMKSTPIIQARPVLTLLLGLQILAGSVLGVFMIQKGFVVPRYNGELWTFGALNVGIALAGVGILTRWKGAVWVYSLASLLVLALAQALPDGSSKAHAVIGAVWSLACVCLVIRDRKKNSAQ
jgi:hypothetical protein